MSMAVQTAAEAGLGGAIQLLTQRTAMHQTASQMAQLLQTLPPAPPPAHLGNSVDVKV